MDGIALRQAIEAELDGNLLPFWRERSTEDELGGFVAEMANDGTVRPDAARGLILTSRLLWTFASLAESRGDGRDLELARRAYEFLENRFGDPAHGGYLWRIDAGGRPLDGTKKVYGQAFAIYALAAYSSLTGEEAPRNRAVALYRLIERYAHDGVHGGYLEARAEDWSPAAQLRLSDKDMVAAKSMNSHLHVLEAYTGLYRVWPDAGLAHRLRELIELFGRHILDDNRRHLRHFFEQDWTVISDAYTYGHDIEAAWLLCEAAETLADDRLSTRVEKWAVEIAEAVLAEAVDEDGGLAYEGRDGAVIDPNREWWCQAEAVIGFRQTYEVTGDQRFLDAAGRVWSFIAGQIVDSRNGEWFWRVLSDGTIDESEPKVSEWKGPYHNVRMCLEMMRRIDPTDSEEGGPG